jgi:AraC-like DNA-binding protein
MKYQLIQPPEFLKNYVRYFWVAEDRDAGNTPVSFTTIPDGAPGLVFQNADKGMYWQKNMRMSQFFLYGSSTKHALVELHGSYCTIVAYFYPHALKSVFGMDANELTDICTDLHTAAPKQDLYIAEQLSESISLTEKIELLSAYIFSLIRKNGNVLDPSIEFSLQQIVQSKGKISMKELQQEMGMSERSIERKFKQYVGMSPKLFTRICRFQATLSQLKNKDYTKLSDIAYDNEYADQSHLTRTFREFTGSAPLEFLKRGNNI